MVRTRNHLAGLCEQIAEVEDSLGDTLTGLADTASEERAGRLRTLASAAHEYAAKERGRAKLYDEPLNPPIGWTGDARDARLLRDGDESDDA
jgi:hypothetical protein